MAFFVVVPTVVAVGTAVTAGIAALGTAVAGVVGITATGALATAIGAGTISATMTAIQGGSVEDILKSAVVGGVTSYFGGTVASEIAGSVAMSGATIAADLGFADLASSLFSSTETIVKSQIIPAGILQTNSIIDVEILYQISYSSGTIILRGFFDTTSSGTGNIFSTTSINTNQLQASTSKQIVNRNSLTNQLVRFTTTGTFGQQGTTTGGLPTFSVNTANNSFINIAINRANTGNTINLVMTKILIYQ